MILCYMKAVETIPELLSNKFPSHMKPKENYFLSLKLTPSLAFPT